MARRVDSVVHPGRVVAGMIREARQPGADNSIELAEAMLDLAGAIRNGREWMDYKEAAAYLGLSESAFKTLARTGEIPRHKFSQGGYRYHAGELTDLLLSK